MALATATNCWTKAEDDFRRFLAELISFQSLVGVDNATQADDHVFLHSIPSPEKPHSGRSSADMRHDQGTVAFVTTNPKNGYRLGESRDTSSYNATGNILIGIEHPVAKSDKHRDAQVKAEVYRDFNNAIGDIMQEMLGYVFENGGPRVRSIQLVEHGENMEDDRPNEGWILIAYLAVSWGVPDDA